MTGNGYYGLSYGVYYGIGEPWPEQWFADVFPPERTREHTDIVHFGDELLSVNIEPEHSAIWDAQIEIPPVIDPINYRGGSVNLRFMGEPFIAFEIETTSVADDGTVTLTGRAAEGLTLTGDESEIEYRRIRTVDAIRDFWNQTQYSTTVHNPSAERVDDLPVLTARTPAGFNELLHARSRDDRGRFLEEKDGSAPNFMPTDPLKLTDSGVELRQSNFIGRAWENTGQSGGVDRGVDFSAVNNSIIRLRGDGATVEWTFEPSYDIPELAVAPRWRFAGPGSDRVSVDVGGETTNTADIATLAEKYYTWTAEPFSFVRGDGVSSGEQTITVTKHGTDDDLYIDLVAMCDTRFAYSWDNSLGESGHLGGPQLYPDNFAVAFDSVEPGIDVSGIDITAEYDSAQPNTPVGAYISGRGVVTKEQTQRRETHHFDVPSDEAVPRIIPRPELRRTGARQNQTPKYGIESQTLTGTSVSVEGENISVIHDSGQTFTGTDLDILQSLHEHAGYVFSLRPDEQSRDPASFQAESFERGDGSLYRDLPPEAVITSLSTESNIEGYANRVTVVGAEFPDALQRTGEPENYSATVEDSEEIARVGIDSITIEDDSLETKGACRSRARAELAQRLKDDARGGSINTTPAVLHPGYPYLVPEITRSAALQDAPALTWDPDNPTRVISQDTTIGDGESLVVSDGDLVWVDNTELTTVGTGEITVESGGRLVATTPGDIPVGETVTVTAAESPLVVREDSTINGTLIIENDARVVVFGGATITVSATGKIVVHGTGELEVRSLADETITCESWSFDESAGSASGSGSFQRVGGPRGEDRAGLLGLLASATGD